MVEIKYINGDIENVETVTTVDGYHFNYMKETQMFVVYTSISSKGKVEPMMIPREFVKSIKYIDTD